MTSNTHSTETIELSKNICKLLDLSTAHIPKHTADALGSKDISNPPLWNDLSYVHYHEYGWIIHCSRDELGDKAQEHPELAALLNLCVDNGIEHLKLDCDAPTVEGLPCFDW
jgi:hypothetical protein